MTVKGDLFSGPEPVRSVYFGTSGYSYEDWVGRFYPKGLKKSAFLKFYARHFPAVEINYTYYRMPTAKSFERMACQTGPGFMFAVKLHKRMTHDRAIDSQKAGEFLEACRPLSERGALAPVLAQFPYSFHKTPDNEDYLRKMRDSFPDTDLVAEFRNVQWVNQEAFDLLKTLRIGFCGVDQPTIQGLMPPVAVATSEIGYIRFHGRNKEKWYEHDLAQERYDYRYSRDELGEWAPKIKKLEQLTKRIYCFCNNHFQSKAVEAAQMLMELVK